MTIGALSGTTGFPASKIRYYERIGILPPPPRVSGQRRYGPESVDRLALLSLAQACGFHLEEMRMLVSAFSSAASPSQGWQELAGKKKQEIKEQVQRLTAMQNLVDRVLRCECIDMRECGRIASSVIREESR